ncbi:MAG: PaaI family thioesterase [Thermaerobacterales bacterium]
MIFETEGAIPFRSLLGIDRIEAAGGRAVLSLPLKPELGNRFGAVHGGALATLVDAAMADAIITCLSGDDRVGGTIEMSLRFIAPVQGDMRAEARTLRVGGRIAFAQAEVFDAGGALVAAAQGSFLVRRGVKRSAP